eukprot:Gb_04354 [translate_table: standard]
MLDSQPFISDKYMEGISSSQNNSLAPVCGCAWSRDMAISPALISSSAFFTSNRPRNPCISSLHSPWRGHHILKNAERVGSAGLVVRRSWGMVQRASLASENEEGSVELVAGSPIVVVEAPTMLKTAEPMPMMRVNSGLIKPGDVGRIISRKPKDVWAVRLSIGAYLIDRKYFKPLQIDK